MSDTAPEVVVRAIAAGGDGVASLPDGRTVFIPRAAPGDVVTLDRVRLHARFARAEIETIVTASTDRVDPPCPHYQRDRCGGCQLMHLDAGAQRGAKARIAGDAMRRLARIDMADPVVTAAPQQFHYRAKVTMAVQGGRMGFHPLGEAERVFDVQECWIAEPALGVLHRAVRAAMRLLPGDTSRVVFRRDRGGALHLMVRTTGSAAWTTSEALAGAIAGAGVTATLWWHPEGGVPRAMAGAADPWPATVFEQVHPAMGDLVRQAAVAAAGDVNGKQAWDLYAGIGETTAALATAGAVVESVELDRRAVELATRIGPAGPVRHAGAVEAMIGRLQPAAVVVTNPPRTGMDSSVTTALAASAAERIVYVSCDPATLARDIARLNSRFRLASLAVFDQFPQTSHLESLAVLERQ
ncbi:MAG TPA: hypothetical protein VHW65_06225 [Gemmatimonadales bacterium]|nr:hypothetical protein [Gemmatimonadales bacterium]